MQKLFFLCFFIFFGISAFSQQHILDQGTIAPCNYSPNPNIRIESNNVTLHLKEEFPINAHVGGKVVSVFKVADTWNVIVKTNEDLFVSFQNLKQVTVKKGDEIQASTYIGLPLAAKKPGIWEVIISYDRREGSLPCEQAIEMIRLSRVNEVVRGDVSE